MNPNPLVSVLVPAYNSHEFIGRCVSSILEQSYQNIELIIVDDCSSDGTYELLKELTKGDRRASLLRNTPNLGSAANFQRTLSLARGPLIKWVCGDDMLRPDAIAKMVEACTGRDDVALVTSRRQKIDEHDRVVCDLDGLRGVHGISLLDGWDAGNFLLQNTLNWIGEPTTVLFHSRYLSPDESFFQIGSRCPAENLDVAWWLRLIAGRKMIYIDEPLSYFRSRAGQKTQQSQLQADLVLSWYDLIVGALELGYLAAPAAEVNALSGLVALINSRFDALTAGRWEDATSILSKVDTRLKLLSSVGVSL